MCIYKLKHTRHGLKEHLPHPLSFLPRVPPGRLFKALAQLTGGFLTPHYPIIIIYGQDYQGVKSYSLPWLSCISVNNLWPGVFTFSVPISFDYITILNKKFPRPLVVIQEKKSDTPTGDYPHWVCHLYSGYVFFFPPTHVLHRFRRSSTGPFCITATAGTELVRAIKETYIVPNVHYTSFIKV